jgi:hypothetical protein
MQTKNPVIFARLRSLDELWRSEKIAFLHLGEFFRVEA